MGALGIGGGGKKNKKKKKGGKAGTDKPIDWGTDKFAVKRAYAKNWEESHYKRLMDEFDQWLRVTKQQANGVATRDLLDEWGEDELDEDVDVVEIEDREQGTLPADAAVYYTSGGFRMLNRMIRSDDPELLAPYIPFAHQINVWIDANLSTMNELFGQKEQIETYRGTGATYEQLQVMAKTKEFRIATFISTSDNYVVASAFGNCVIKFIISPNCRAAYLEGITANETEQEVLLPPYTPVKPLKLVKSNDAGKPQLDVLVLPFEGTKKKAPTHLGAGYKGGGRRVVRGGDYSESGSEEEDAVAEDHPVRVEHERLLAENQRLTRALRNVRGQLDRASTLLRGE